MKKFLSILLCTVMLASCFVGSAAAADISYGDVDDGNGITSGDARLVLRYSVGLETFTAEQILAADVDGDGNVSAGDARLILRASVGLEDSANFGIPDSQILMSGTYVLKANIDLESGTSFTLSRTNNSSYMEASIDIDMSDGTTNTGKPVRIGFLTIEDKVYWVLPDANPLCYLLIDDKVSENMGITADMFKELIPQISTAAPGSTPDKIVNNVSIGSKKYTRHIYFNDDGTQLAYDMLGIRLKYLRTFDASGNETSCMTVDSVSADVPAYQKGLPSGSKLYASKEGDAEDNIGYITAFLLEFAALANIPTEDILG